jgi:hypothetical protein
MASALHVPVVIVPTEVNPSAVVSCGQVVEATSTFPSFKALKFVERMVSKSETSVVPVIEVKETVPNFGSL